ncbi:MAG: PDZ domain-containing protein [Pirellulaceae bacterium]|nr:PDZ domain-containing protein [Pirellulaceae bacterium]
MLARCLFCLLLLAPNLALAQGQTREQKVRADREKVEAEGFWIYNDLPRAFAEARRTGKPILVVLRCIPCEECVKLDDDLVDQDPIIRPLLEKFVCVRQVSTNGLDLNTFQFDTDQSFAAFLLNADGTIYGRFGTRSHRTEWSADVSLPGLAKALEGALALHANFPRYKEALAAKRGPALEFSSPEKYPALQGKYATTLNFTGNVVQSCIHCHQIGDAQRDFYRSQGKPIPDTVLFPYPHPKSIGLTLDPEDRATVKAVEPSSRAALAGFQPGDEILQLAGQPLLSIADVQWVLHSASPSGAELVAEVRRGDQTSQLTLSLPTGWRRQDDISWRASTWGLRRMVTGGLVLETLPDEARRELNLPDGSMALRVKHVGQYGAHAAAKRAGFQQGDVIVEFDGRSDLPREADLLALGATAHKPGEQVNVTLLRGGKRVTLRLPMQP